MEPCSDSASLERSRPPRRPFPAATRSPWTLGEHVVLKTPSSRDEVPAGHEVAIFGLGCFWGAEALLAASRRLDHLGRVRRRQHRPPVVEEACSGLTGHTEAVPWSSTRPWCRTGPGQGVLRDPRPDPRDPAGKRRRHAVSLGPLLTPPSRRDGCRADQGVRRKLARRRLGGDHQPEPAGEKASLLLRRGPAPAVPRQGPERLPVPRQHGSALSFVRKFRRAVESAARRSSE